MAYLWELGEGASHQPGRRREPHREAGKRRASGAARSGSEPARSSCGGGSLEAAQHSRIGEHWSRVGLGAGRRPANRRPAGSRDGVPGSACLRLACRMSPPPRGRREETSRESRGFTKPVRFYRLPVKPVRPGFGLGRYQTSPNSKFKFEFKKMKIPKKIPKNTSRCDKPNGVKFSQNSFI